MALKVGLCRAKTSMRARPHFWETRHRKMMPTRRITTRKTRGDTALATMMLKQRAAAYPISRITETPAIAGCGWWGWEVSSEVSAEGPRGAESSSKWTPERAVLVCAGGRRDGISPPSGGAGGRINPYDANAGQRFEIALAPQTILDFVLGGPNYKPLRLLTAGVAGKS